ESASFSELMDMTPAVAAEPPVEDTFGTRALRVEDLRVAPAPSPEAARTGSPVLGGAPGDDPAVEAFAQAPLSPLEEEPLGSFPAAEESPFDAAAARLAHEPA